MMQAATVRRSFHLQLLPIQVLLQQVLDVEIVQHRDGAGMYQQNLMSLGAEVQRLENCDLQDVSIAILEGSGDLSVNDELVKLEPEMFVFIPANTDYTLRIHAKLIFLLNRCRPDPTICASPWIMNL
jgi:hypothetical protein